MAISVFSFKSLFTGAVLLTLVCTHFGSLFLNSSALSQSTIILSFGCCADAMVEFFVIVDTEETDATFGEDSAAIERRRDSSGPFRVCAHFT